MIDNLGSSNTTTLAFPSGTEAQLQLYIYIYNVKLAVIDFYVSSIIIIVTWTNVLTNSDTRMMSSPGTSMSSSRAIIVTKKWQQKIINTDRFSVIIDLTSLSLFSK